MEQYFVDLHVHIGQTASGSIIKMAASKKLTLENIAIECSQRKGINIVGIVDALSPKVWEDWEHLIAEGQMYELVGGGLRYRDCLTILLGCELETVEESGGAAHVLAYFPYKKKIDEFAQRMKSHVKNINLSTQRCNLSLQQLWEIVDSCEGVMIPAHVFTPHKSLYGNCTDHLEKVFTEKALNSIPAVELGLSSDTKLGDMLSELREFVFLSNSDAHSLSKIGREYNIMKLEKPDFKEVLLALKNKEGRKITANFGLNPKLGKYHRTFCRECSYIAVEPPPVVACPRCKSKRTVKGVLDRITEITDDHKTKHSSNRPPYLYQIPLEFVPQVGKKTLDKLICAFGSEMMVLHMANVNEISSVVGEKIAYNIDLARKGALNLKSGGGGKYGKLLVEK